jgi:uncharacterized membrane-anchored protein
MTIGKILSVLGISLLTMSKDIWKTISTFNFQTNADYIGTFVIVYLSLGGGFVFSMILLGDQSYFSTISYSSTCMDIHSIHC